MTSRPLTRPDDRYGDVTTRGGLAGKFVAALLVVLVAALMIAGGVTIYRINATPSISGEVVGVDVVDDRTLDVVFTVTRDEPSTPSYCILRAQDESKGELGRVEVYIPPSEYATVRADATITTTDRGFMADIYGCGDDVPDYLNR